MSAKQLALATIEQLPDDATATDVLSAVAIGLRGDLGRDGWDSELTDEDWRQFIARGLAAELADPREDLYTLEDGTPIHDAR